MGQITVTVGERSYALGCRDGEEERLRSLAEHLNSKTETLKGALGAVSETRMLLMAGLLMADEVFEMRDAGGSVPSTMPVSPSGLAGVAIPSTTELEQKLGDVTQRLENLAATLY